MSARERVAAQQAAKIRELLHIDSQAAAPSESIIRAARSLQSKRRRTLEKLLPVTHDYLGTRFPVLTARYFRDYPSVLPGRADALAFLECLWSTDGLLPTGSARELLRLRLATGGHLAMMPAVESYLCAFRIGKRSFMISMPRIIRTPARIFGTVRSHHVSRPQP